MNFTLPLEFGNVILSIVGMNVQCAFAGFAIMGPRKKYGVKYPDMGSGIYAKKLTDAQWEDFNNHMRVHHNFLEDITLMSVLSVLGGLNNARAQLLFNLVYMAGRFFYGVGYVQSKTDGNGRFIGALILDVGKVATVVNAAWFGLSVAGYI